MPGRATGRFTALSKATTIAVLSVSVLVLTGCGPGGESAVPEPPKEPTTTAPPPVPVVKLPPDTPALTSIIPKPVRVDKAPKANFRLAPETEIQAAGPAKTVAGYVREVLRPATGFELPVREAVDAGTPVISLRLVNDRSLAPEAYRLDVTPGGVTITAGVEGGLFAGVQTLRQLLPADIERRSPVRRDWAVTGGSVLDQPRFAYRGAMLDVARHFFDADVVKRHIDRIAQYKINHLHLHLADDQGWRIEIKSWPKLATVGGKTQVGGGKGGFYTQEEYRDIVSYAASRGIVIVPEVDLPGHTNAALTAYPELNCDGKARTPYTDTQVGFSSLCIGSATTYRFVQDVVDELAALTPGDFLHIGGDEAQQTTSADYRSFFARVLPMVVAAGKRPVGWHEYAGAKLPASAVVQYWRLEAENALTRKAAAAGRQVVMSPANKTYLDMKYFEGDARGNKWAGPVSMRTAYEWNPASFLAGVGERSVLGVEAPLWTELVETEGDIERQAFPRIPALAEVGWSAQETRGWKSFGKRLAAQAERMTAQGIGFHRSPDVPW